ncbi:MULTISPECIES: ABC transporter ATP-binding protein [unclassified Mesorhizobium]|uniref:ABC transporter ATP-binding protein n=1 Tax=unclassified Mesorhizobium TaxID=325217 RepID=UPI00122687F6|nr:ABC transporter ATP-binding protein [Mesorhizobium sp.]TIS53072.1 MAG: ABC transporter ATP-binding protein [Mesorhizobium sp.]TIS88819.1 MAG: ABC transporter ATP-binding protein [Mesorhizobium sp.]TJW43835.1 MAG: ABC transporter ATP-binding protein [Mesorhizobium sp.]
MSAVKESGGTAIQAQRLSLRGLGKSFGAIKVVSDLCIDVAPGEFLVLLGPSGCGKTTGLRIIAGLETADTGQVVLGDTDVTNILPKYRDVAMVFQSYALYPHKTVAENIDFPLKVRGFPQQERKIAVREAAAQVHMEGFLDRYPRQLSGGQRQRVALARAIVRRPSVFLMDEPLSNLDAKLRGFMRAELKRMQHDLGVTTIYVTHDQVEAMTLAHRIAIMEQGVLQQIGTPREVYDHPANLFVAGFIGSPPMNFLHGRIENDRFETYGVNLPVAAVNAPAVAAAVMGFRPEDACIVEPGSGLFDATVYAAEPTGDVTLVTLLVGKESVSVKMPKNYYVDFDSKVAVRFPLERGFLFDANSGKRLALQLGSAY